MLARIVFVSEWLQSPALLRCTEPRRMTRCWCLHRIATATKSAWRTPSRSSPLFYSQSPDGRLRTLCSHMRVAQEPTLLLPQLPAGAPSSPTACAANAAGAGPMACALPSKVHVTKKLALQQHNPVHTLPCRSFAFCSSSALAWSQLGPQNGCPVHP